MKSLMTRDLSAFWDDLVACGSDVTRLFALITRRVTEIVGDASVLTTLSPDGSQLEPVALHHDDPAVRAFMRHAVAAAPYRVGEGVAGQVAASRQAIVLNDLDPGALDAVAVPATKVFAERFPMHAIAVVPMIAFGDLVGTLGAVRISSAEPYDDEDVIVLEALAERAALALADAKRMPGQLGPDDYEAIFRHSIDGVLFSVPDGRVLAANPAACDILRMSETAICRVGRAGILVKDDPSAAAAVVQRALTGQVRAEVRMRRGDGEVFVAEVASTIFTTAKGEIRACVIFRDVTDHVTLRQELEEKTEALERLSEEDELTHLRNRRGFLHAAEQALAFADRETVPVHLAFFDLDGLKAINDTSGHDAGDAVITALGRAIREATRAVDIAGRLGGDEFVVLLYNAAAGDAHRAVARIQAAFAEEANASVSVGLAARPPGSGVALVDLLRDADEAMYRHKLRARN
jgi:diguanylate cyclase (GGDEF)-like protein/PAS domain S-box-containing protein